MFSRLALAASALAAWSLAWGQAPAPPERLLRVSHVEGEVALKSDGRRVSDARPNEPLMAGDLVVTPHGSRAELLLDASPIRLSQRSELRVDALEAMHVQLGLVHGVASLHIRELYEGEQFEIALANVRLALRQPGEYRIEARESDYSVLTVTVGVVDVATVGGLVPVTSGQRVILEGRDPRATLVPAVAADAFDDWVLEREVQLASENLPAGPDESAAYAQAGRWYDDATYGHYWMADTSYGYAPWSFFYFSSGRWGFHVGQGRWCWSPPRPSQGPAVAQETHPFGRARSASRGGAMQSGMNSGAGTRNSGRSWAFGGSGSSGMSSGGTTHSMRGSASYGRPHSSSPSSGSSSVFGVPTSP